MMILLIAFRVHESSLELCCFCCVFLQQATFLCPLFLQVLQLSSLMVVKIFFHVLGDGINSLLLW